MIDLHCHLLNNVDDGSKTVENSLQMAKEAQNDGISKILLTPHHMDGEYINHRDETIKKAQEFQQILYDNNIDIEVRAGQEVHINGNLLNSVENNDVLFADQKGKYMMLELPHSGVPEYTKNMIFELQIKGIVPIIVHPERNYGFRNNPNELYDIVEQGCLTQITATSYLGGFGKNVKKFTEEIIDAGLGHTFSSDAHNMSGRRFRMKEAYDLLAKRKGLDLVNYYEDNAKKIWEGQDIETFNINHIKRHKSWISIFKK